MKLNPRTKALLAKVDRGSYMTRAGSKSEAHAYYKAMKNKKKLPTFHREFKGKDSEFANLTMSEYKKKYKKEDRWLGI